MTQWTAACQDSLSFSISLSFLKLMSIESVMPSNHFILYRLLLLLLSIFPSIRVFSNVHYSTSYLFLPLFITTLHKGPVKNLNFIHSIYTILKIPVKFQFWADKLHAYYPMLCDYKCWETRDFALGQSRAEKLSVVMEIFCFLIQKTNISVLLRLWKQSTWDGTLCSPTLPLNTLWVRDGIQKPIDAYVGRTFCWSSG